MNPAGISSFEGKQPMVASGIGGQSFKDPKLATLGGGPKEKTIETQASCKPWFLSGTPLVLGLRIIRTRMKEPYVYVGFGAASTP